MTNRRRGRPKVVEQLDTTAAILDAALREFARQGFEGARVAKIAQRAGVAKPLIHYHFATKDQLWRAAVDRAFDDMRAGFLRLPSELEDLDLVARAKVIIRRYVAFVARRPELGRLIVIEASKPTPRARWLVETHLLPMNRLVESIVELAQHSGALKPIPPSQLVPMVNGAINVYFAELFVRRQYAGESLALEDQHVDEFADNVIEVFTSGILPRGGVDAASHSDDRDPAGAVS